jgi:hypothetical protein
MAEIKTDRTVHMIPPRPFPRPAARGRDPASLPGVSTSCRVGSRLAITLCAMVDHYIAFLMVKPVRQMSMFSCWKHSRLHAEEC